MPPNHPHQREFASCIDIHEYRDSPEQRSCGPGPRVPVEQLLAPRIRRRPRNTPHSDPERSQQRELIARRAPARSKGVHHHPVAGNRGIDAAGKPRYDPKLLHHLPPARTTTLAVPTLSARSKMRTTTTCSSTAAVRRAAVSSAGEGAAEGELASRFSCAAVLVLRGTGT